MLYGKEKIALGIFIFSISAIVILIVLLLPQINITGKVVEGFESDKGVLQQTTCSDSDDGKDYDVKGTVRYCADGDCLDMGDSCSGKTLTEWYCENNEKYSSEYSCEYDCYSGMCVNLVTKYIQPNIGGGSGGGGSGGSGGSAAVSQEVPAVTYDLGEVSSEQSIELVKNENIKFKIAGQEYTINLQDNTPVQATIAVSGGSSFNIMLGEDNKIDLNSDGTSDLYVKLKSVNTINGKVKLILYNASYYG